MGGQLTVRRIAVTRAQQQAYDLHTAPLVEAGQLQRAIAAALNNAGHRTERGALWSQRTIGRVIERLRLLAAKQQPIHPSSRQHNDIIIENAWRT